MTIGQNTIIKNFRIIRKIGSGGMGEVFEAEDISLKRKVAIKMLNPSLLSSDIIIKRFKEEAKILASFHHDNIVKVHSFFEYNSNYFMVMEYIEGKTLKEQLNNHGLITEEKAKEIILQVLEALNYAHHKKVIHRDIKSSNIMISKSGNVKLMDFGIAKQLSEEFSKDGGLTKTNTQMGTVYYMSPEQIKSTKGVDKRTDIFSLGVTFFEMLTSHLPYDIEDKSDYEIKKQIVQAPLPNPNDYYPYISDRTVYVLKKMVEKETKDRFQDCNEPQKYLLNDEILEIKKPIQIKQIEVKKGKSFKFIMFILLLVFGTIIGLNNKDEVKKIYAEIVEYFDNTINSPKSTTISLNKLNEVIIYPKSQSDIYAASFSNDLQNVIIGTRSGSLEQINLSTENQEELFNYNQYIWSLCIDKNNDIIVGLDDGSIQEYNVEYVFSKLLSKYSKPIYCIVASNEVNDIGFSQDGIFYFPKNNIKNKIFKNYITTMNFDNDFDVIGFGDKNGNVRIYENPSMRLSCDLKANSGVYSITFYSKDTLIIGCEDGSISFWDLTQETPVNIFENKEHKGCIKALKYAQESNTLLSFSNDSTTYKSIIKWEIIKVKK